MAPVGSATTGDVCTLAKREIADGLGTHRSGLEGQIGLEVRVLSDPTRRYRVVEDVLVDGQLVGVDPVRDDGGRSPRHVGDSLGDGIRRAVVQEALES